MSSTDDAGTARSDTADREVAISRLIHARRELVFRAFSDVRHLAQWWGPDGFTTTTRSFDFRVGGVWDFVMHGPDGTDYPEWITWTEIDPPARIVLLHGEYRDDPSSFTSVLTFTPQLGRGGGDVDDAAGRTGADAEGADTEHGDVEHTLIEMRTVFPTTALRDEAVESHGAIEGGRQTLGNLAVYVEQRLR
ncbi:SRPBCC domain-containing protein [Georgenia sp. Z1491]|uniref:SRPBCC domain-containing protein n=1 Tax=Georgenia sp. Z1491 TaxID=3416707 RepID=UPI003CED6413